MIFSNVGKPICLEQLVTIVNKYIFPKWRRGLTIIISKNISNSICFRNAADKRQQLQCAEMSAMDVSNYNVQKYWGQLLKIRNPRNAGDKYKPL